MTVSRTVVPGEWYGVLGDNVIVLLPPESKARVAGLWETVDEGAGFDEVLDALIAGGLRSLPSFVLVSGEGRAVKVVIRGPGEAELTTSEGPITVSGSADTTWVERNVAGVTGLRVRVAEGDGEAYAVGSGLVRVASVEHPARAATPAASAAPDAVAVAVPIEPPQPDPVPEPQPVPARPARILPPDPLLEAEHAQPEPDPEPAPVPVPMPVPVPVVTTPTVAPVPGAPVPVPDGSGAEPYDPLTSPDLAVTPVHASDARAAESAAETADESGDDSGDTQAGGFVATPPGDSPESSAPTPRPVARLIFSSGEVVDVDRAVVVGRAPEHGRFGADERTRLVSVPSPHQEISSTHLEVRPGTGADHGSAVVTDLGSTNGTVVAQPGLPAEDLRPGVAVQLLPGATIDLGEGVTIQVSSV